MDIFKCKKCGSDKYALEEKNNGSGIATGLYCAKCGFWHKWVGKEELYKLKAFLTKKELSTAEKLLWLIENGASIDGTIKLIDCAEQNSIRYFWGKKLWEIFEDHKVGKIENILCDTMEQAIDTAFKAVKEKL